MNRETLVFVDVGGTAQSIGRLWCRSRQGRESATFAYDATWLHDSRGFALEPGLPLGPGPLHTTAGRTLFGVFSDAAPDRWGRTLVRRAERQRARAEGRTLRTMFEIDFLLAVDDEARQGALRLKEAPEGPFLAPSARSRIPPLVDLPHLLEASNRVELDQEGDEDILLLLAPGSSLGGARPKASIRERDGGLAIAKFPSASDEAPVVVWEAVALTLASRAGIPVPRFRVVEAAGRSVLVSRRFDRRGSHRIPFLSGLSLIDARDNEMRSYLEVADAIHRDGARATADLQALWRRIIFNVLISNTDDHLRNLGFLHEPGGWTLSPAYDLNPVPVEVRPRILSTAIDTDDSTASLDLALSVADYFRLGAQDARDIARTVATAVSCWRETAKEFGLRPSDIDRMASAFEHQDLARALA